MFKRRIFTSGIFKLNIVIGGGIMKTIVFTWIDAAIHGSDTFSRKEAEEVGLIKGVVTGFLVKETKDYITVAMDYFPEEDTFRTIQTYPKSGIKKVHKFLTP